MTATRRVVAIALVVGILVLTVLTAGTSTPRSAFSTDAGGTLPATSGAYSLTNGKVAAVFPSPSPAFTLTAVTNSTVELTQTVSGLAEISPRGQIVASASFTSSAVRWRAEYANDSQGSSVNLSAAVPVQVSSGTWGCGCGMVGPANSSLGSVNVSVVFSLNVSSGPAPATVGFGLRLTSWPWQRAMDSLGIAVQTNATGSSGTWTKNGTNSLAEKSSTVGGTLAEFSWGSSATARSSSGQGSRCAVASLYNISSDGMDALVSLEFGSSASYQSLWYDPWLNLGVPGSVIPPIPSAHALAAWAVSPEGIAAMGAGVVVSVVLAGAAIRRRRPPGSDL